MVMHNLERITAAMREAGIAASMPAAVIVSASTPKQRVVVSTLEKLASDVRAQKLEPPAIVVIGEVVKLRDALAVGEPNASVELK
jgi:siroheme synthase